MGLFVCAGFPGRNKHPGWSTWSPGRVALPDSDDALEACWKEFVKANLNNTLRFLDKINLFMGGIPSFSRMCWGMVY